MTQGISGAPKAITDYTESAPDHRMARYSNNIAYSSKRHVVWCQKYRRKMPERAIESRLKQILAEMREERKTQIIEMAGMMAGHEQGLTSGRLHSVDGRARQHREATRSKVWARTGRAPHGASSRPAKISIAPVPFSPQNGESYGKLAKEIA